MRISVVSDTHGLLRPELLPLLRTVEPERILHLGDVGDRAILDALETLAPVTAICGNIDTRGPCALLPATEVVTIGGLNFYLLHNVQDLDLNPVAASFAAVLFGHTHKPEIRRHKSVLYLNPGSCGPRRFQLPVTCATITINENGQLEAEILQLPITSTK